MAMRLCAFTLALGAVFAAAAIAEPRRDDVPRITLTDQQLPPINVALIPNCGDPVPWRFAVDPRVTPPPGAVPIGSGAYLTTHDNVVHIPLVVTVKNVGRQPAGGVDGGRLVIVSQRPARGGPMTQLLRAAFRALGADESQAFAFEMRVPVAGTGRWTVTAILNYPRPDTFRPETADCVMTNNKLSLALRLW